MYAKKCGLRRENEFHFFQNKNSKLALLFDLRWKGFHRAKRLRLKFKAHRDHSWGVEFNFGDDWSVRRVIPGGQFDKHGVKRGWKILKLGRYRLTGKHAVSAGKKKILKRLLERGLRCHIVFQTVTSDFISVIMNLPSRGVTFPRKSKYPSTT